MCTSAIAPNAPVNPLWKGLPRWCFTQVRPEAWQDLTVPRLAALLYAKSIFPKR